MIHTVEKNRYIDYNSPLIDYIKARFLYANENLIYTKKYSNGTFSITNPNSDFSNCEFINGYPHFDIPLEKCIEEIEFFLSDGSMYRNNFCIRYGDTHPHKCIPKLAQVRNLIIENSLSNMIGANSKSFYGFGDISLKSLNDFVGKYDINCSPHDLLKKIINNDVPEDIRIKLDDYNSKALSDIKLFLDKIELDHKNFLIESDLYSNQELFNYIKNNPNFISGIRETGDFKYSLQELMFINSLKSNNSDIIINIIGSNQVSHIMVVHELLKDNFNVRNRFLTYEICRNGENRDIETWSKMLSDFIEKNNLKINNEFISYQDFLKILVTINSNDVILDYNQLIKYKNYIFRFSDMIDGINKLGDNKNLKSKNDLICKMALVCYNLNRSIEMGNQNNFYKYLMDVVNEYENNREKYVEINGLYKLFLSKCLDKLGYKKSNKIKELII